MAVNLKYYRKLKSLMFEREIDQAYIAQKAGRSRGYISDRFQDKKPFDNNVFYLLFYWGKGKIKQRVLFRQKRTGISLANSFGECEERYYEDAACKL